LFRRTFEGQLQLPMCFLFVLHIVQEKAFSPDVVIFIPMYLCTRNMPLVQILPEPLRKG